MLHTLCVGGPCPGEGGPLAGPGCAGDSLVPSAGVVAEARARARCGVSAMQLRREADEQMFLSVAGENSRMDEAVVPV